MSEKVVSRNKKHLERRTEGEWRVSDHALPIVEIECDRGRLLEMYGAVSTKQANAQFICKAVNAHEKLVEALSETLQELKYALQTHVDILRNAGMLSGSVEDNSTVKKASKLLQSLTP